MHHRVSEYFINSQVLLATAIPLIATDPSSIACNKKGKNSFKRPRPTNKVTREVQQLEKRFRRKYKSREQASEEMKRPGKAGGTKEREKRETPN